MRHTTSDFMKFFVLPFLVNWLWVLICVTHSTRDDRCSQIALPLLNQQPWLAISRLRIALTPKVDIVSINCFAISSCSLKANNQNAVFSRKVHQRLKCRFVFMQSRGVVAFNYDGFIFNIPGLKNVFWNFIDRYSTMVCIITQV